MQRVTKTALARLDLLETWLYIAENNPRAANRLTEEIDKRCQMLAQYPLAGTIRDELAPNLYSFPVGTYVIFYRPTDRGIELIRVIHGARDLPSMFPTRVDDDDPAK